MGFVVWLAVGFVLLCVSLASAKPTQKEIEAFSKRFKNIDATKFFELKEKMKARSMKMQSETAGIQRVSVPTPRPDELPSADEIIVANNKTNMLGMLFEGDIVLTNDQIDALSASLDGTRSRRQAINKANWPQRLWPNRTVYYQIAANYDSEYRELFKKAVAFWSDNTCLRFQESSTAQNRLNVHHGDGCYTYLGMIGGFQNLSLDFGCSHAAKHEIGHALGLVHEQSRHDRDEYVTVQWQNIWQSPEQFLKYRPYDNDNMGVPYDYSSVMHYSANAFGVYDTLVAKDPTNRFTMGNTFGTFFDLLAVNKLHGCEDVCASCNTVCHNGGIRNPKNCSVCVCPSGYDGPTCSNTRHLLKVGGTTTMAIFTTWMGTDLYGLSHLEAPEGYKVKLTISKFEAGKSCKLGCNDAGIEVKWKTDQRESGYRFCCESDQGKSIVSEGRYLTVINHISVNGTLRYYDAFESVPDSTPSGLQ